MKIIRTKHASSIPVEKIEYGLYKYVCVNGQYRFTDNYSGHASLIKPGEKAESAGIIGVNDDYWDMMTPYSSTLGVGSSDADISNISALLKRPYRERPY